MPDLPIDDVLPDLKAALRDTPEAVLQAPTGAGKTTRVPPALLGEDWLGDDTILMLEPRRLAARSAARFMAKQMGEEPGQTVGYRVRMDTQVSRQTRIEVVTEGVLTRMLQDDPALEGIGAVLFDEFHERNLQADLGLALTLQAREVLRPELRVLVMSATLDTGPIAELLDAPLIESEGRSYPVEVYYRDQPVKDRIESAVASKVQEALDDTDGDVLVFLPGAGEIRRTKSRLEDNVPDDVDLYPLFGNLPPEKQDKAIAPSSDGRRKVVIATDIAETSLTIEGVRVVVDSGHRRAPRFDAASGMTRLETVKISQASADQRKGRAGRVAPGTCYRLWTERTHHHLDRHTPPEIENADLAPLALELAAWGTPDPSDLRWLDPPPDDAYERAQRLLRRLGAIDDESTITDHGHEMANLGLHPRLAHMLINAQTLGHGALACDLAALLSERDIFKGQGEAPDVDLRLRLEALRRLRRGDRPTPDHARNYVVPYGPRQQSGHVRKVADHWRSKLGVSQDKEGDIEACGLLTAFAYPDRIAQRMDGQSGRFRLRNGQVAELPNPQLLSDEDYLVAAHVDGRRQTNRIFLAAPITEAEVVDYFGDEIEPTTDVAWDGDAKLVRARRRAELGALVLKEGPIENPDPTAMAEAMVQGIREEGLDLLPWTDHTRQLQHRIQFLHHHLGDDWPDVRDEALLDDLEDWLLPHVYDMKRADDLQQLNLPQILRDRLTYEQRDRLDSWAPTHIEVPSGFDRPIDYSDPETPVLAVRLQEMFGQTETPRIAGGQVPLTLHLLSPAQRPVQITQDLEGFWTDTYYEVRKDMRGRYSKHYWPEDPLTATPTHTTKAQMEADQ